MNIQGWRMWNVLSFTMCTSCNVSFKLEEEANLCSYAVSTCEVHFACKKNPFTRTTQFQSRKQPREPSVNLPSQWWRNHHCKWDSCTMFRDKGLLFFFFLRKWSYCESIRKLDKSALIIFIQWSKEKNHFSLKFISFSLTVLGSSIMSFWSPPNIPKP